MSDRVDSSDKSTFSLRIAASRFCAASDSVGSLHHKYVHCWAGHVFNDRITCDAMRAVTLSLIQLDGDVHMSGFCGAVSQEVPSPSMIPPLPLCWIYHADEICCVLQRINSIGLKWGVPHFIILFRLGFSNIFHNHPASY